MVKLDALESLETLEILEKRNAREYRAFLYITSKNLLEVESNPD